MIHSPPEVGVVGEFVHRHQGRALGDGPGLVVGRVGREPVHLDGTKLNWKNVITIHSQQPVENQFT